MIRPLLFVLLCLLVMHRSFSQKTEHYYTYQLRDTDAVSARFYSLTEKTDSGWRRRFFFLHSLLLRSDALYEDSACTVPFGHYRSWFFNGRPETTGTYSKANKKGLWMRFYSNGMVEDSTVYEDGHPIGVRQSWHTNGFARDSAFHYPDGSGAAISWFDNGYPAAAGRYGAGGRPYGKWAFFYRSGATSSFEMYDKNGNLVDKQYFDEGGNPRTDTINTDRKAAYPGGVKAWSSYLKQALHAPAHYPVMDGDEAVVVVEATISEAGKITDVEVAIPFYPDFDKAALEVIRNSPDWIPALEHNRPVKTTIRQAVTFSRPD
jgi:TonB family protein